VPVFICQSCGAEHNDWGGNCPNCGGSETIRLQAQQDKFVGRTVKNKYKIVKRLGQGGMGAVYLAEQIGIGLKVALKFLKAELSSDPEVCKRFLNEAKSYALVAHPNAVTLHEFGQDEEGNLFIAMEYVEGIDLKKELAEKQRLPVYEAMTIVLQATDILGHAHSRGVVHRDLKPENIMLRRGSRGIHIKIMDFGISKLTNDAGTKLTLAGSIAGTPRYMSPEQVEGREVDHRVDIYSLGIVLYEMLTGVQPFDGSSIGEILRKQVTQPMPSLGDHAGDFVADLPPIDDVLQKACAKDRTERFQSMAAFAEALEQFQVTQQVRVPSGLGNTAADRIQPLATGQVSIAGNVTGLQTGTSDAGTINAGASILNKSLDGRTSADLALAIPKKGNGAMIGAGVGVMVLAGAVAFFAFSPSKAATVPTPPPVVEKKDPTPAPQQPQQPVDTVPLKEALTALQRQNASNAMGNGTTEFSNGNLDTAKNWFTSVPEGADDFQAAQAQLKLIEQIQTTTNQGQSLRGSGRCSDAIGYFQKALKLNGRYKPAQDGLSYCSTAKVPTVME
jgi:eukaryotic-like serine/threonine-protein kinase